MNQLEEALALIRSKDYQGALSKLQELVSSPNSRAEALGHRAWLQLSIGLPEQALADYRALQELNPENRELKSLIALCHCEMGDHEEALRLAVSALQEDPRQPHAYRVVEKIRRAFGYNESDSHAPWTEAPDEQHANHVIARLEEDKKSFPISCHPTVGRCLYSLVRMLRPKTVVETGSYIGYSSSWLAQALADNEHGHLHAFDLFLPLENYVSPVLGSCANCFFAASGHLQAANLADRATLHPGNSPKKIEQFFAKANTTIDFAFIDGDHSCRGACADFAAIDPYLSTGAVVVLHDTIPENGPWLGPRYLLEQLEKQHQGKYSVLNLPSPDGLGLGLIQKEAPGLAKLTRPDFFFEAAERWRYDRLWFKRKR